MPASIVMAVSCFIVGDCIATRPFGLGGQFPACGVSAKVGAGSAAIIPRVPKAPLSWLVISAGSNDPTNPRLPVNLESMRARASADRVVWVLPAHAIAAAKVRGVAERHGDGVVEFVAGRDRVHPRSYQAVADSVLRVIRPASADLKPLR
jgi:hypothetical protein